MDVLNKRSNVLPWLMWGIATLFFAYQFILRLAPSLIRADIMSKFQVHASDYGIFAAAYYIGYAGMQIPISLALDKFGPRLVLFLSAFLAALASLTVIYSDSWAVILLSRFVVGAGSAAGFLGVSKVVALWFDSRFYGRMIGVSFSFGLLGAVYGGRPVLEFITMFGWQDVTIFVGITGVIIAILLLSFVKRPKHFVALQDVASDAFGKVIFNRQLIFLSLASLLLVGSLEGFADVWGVSYFERVYNIQRDVAAMSISGIFIGMILGAPLLALIAEKWSCHYLLSIFCGLIMSTIFFILIFAREYLSVDGVTILMFVNGVCCCYQVLVLTIGFNSVKASSTSVAVAFLNCINMLGGSFFHSIIGGVMDSSWRGEMLDNIRVYDAVAYNKAIISIPIAALVGTGLLLFLYLRRKNHKTN